MRQKLRNDYHQASQWAHHHSAMLILGLTMVAASFGWQFGSHFINSQAQAAYDPTPWLGRCDTNSGSYIIDTSECYALANIYAQLDGPDWNISINPPDVTWFSDTDIENWYGIGLSGSHVDRLTIQGTSGLGFGQTPSFAGLPYLTYLWFWSSDISGIDVSSNTSLEHLDFRYHQYVTSLDVSNLTNLLHLDLEGNQITSIDLSNLSSLKSLALSNNYLTDIDVTNNLALEDLSYRGGDWYFGGIYVLTSIDLSQNNNLKTVSLYANNLTSIDLSNKPNLTYVDIRQNDIQGSLDLSTAAGLTYLNAEGNQFSSVSLPVGATGLNTINFINNNLTSIDLSPIIGSTGVLHYLYLEGNLINNLGTNFDQFTQIGFMSMPGEFANQMNGNCLDPETLSPSDIAALNTIYTNWEANQTCGRDVSEAEYNTLVALYQATDGDNWANNDGWLQDNTVCDRYGVTCGGNNTFVYGLYLQTNNLNGYIPPLEDLTNLVDFYADNWNDDILPDNTIDVDLAAFANMPNLQRLSIYQSQSITGRLESLLVVATPDPERGGGGVVNQLHFLQLSNPAEPFIYSPSELGQFSNLNSVFLANNIIVGDMAPLANLSNMQYLDLSCYNTVEDCAATGTLDFLSNMPNIISLDLESLGLEGPLPNAINNLPLLEYTTLSENKFTGPLPTFAASTQLKTIGLHMNNFSGTIPASWSSLSELEEIHIGGNSMINRFLVGSLPDSWSNLSNLEVINISFTKIGGSLPASWSSLSNLVELRIFFSSIGGSIPTEWSAFTDLSFDRFWLNNNHLEGDIPGWFADMNQNFKIDNNCLNTTNLDPALEQALDQYNAVWPNQNNCLSNVTVTKTLSNENPEPGQDFTMTISYVNQGSQRAPRFQVNEVLDTDIQLISSIPPEVPAIVNKQFGVVGDVCYDGLLYNETGPYYDQIAQTLVGFIGNDEDPLPPDLTSQQIFDYAFMGFTDGGTTIEEIRTMLNDQNATTGGIITTLLCTIVNGGGTTPEELQSTYATMGQSSCMQVFGIDYRSYDAQCGVGGEEGYRWNVGDLNPGQQGQIVLTLRLVPNLSVGSEHPAITYLVLDGENQGNNTIPVSIFAGGNSGGGNPGAGGSQGGNGGGNGGGSSSTPSAGGATTLVVDDCSDYIPPVDKSSSYYDAKCEQETAEEKHNAPKMLKKLLFDDPIAFTKRVQEIVKSMKGTYEIELVQAYAFARDIGMTTIDSIDDARLFHGLRRDEAAKIMSKYAIEVLGMEPNLERDCTFVDMARSSDEMQGFAKLACQLGIMGMLPDGKTPAKVFNPSDLVDRSQYGTMMSRMIYEGEITGTDACRYCNHLTQLKKDGIMTQIDVPTQEELRGYVMLMLMRAYTLLKK